jgi:glycosyltransferase involved in cell wall biosynthesis
MSDSDFLIIGVGRMVPQKRPLDFLARAAEISTRFPAAKFLWVGDGQLSEEWDQWVARRNLEKTIRRMPWRNDVPSLLMAADVFLHVAEYEGLPLAILEAMSAGLPCAISANLFAEMPFQNGANAICVTEDGTWMTALEKREKLKSIGAAARQLVEKKYSYGSVAEAYEAVYRLALGGKA